MNLRVTRTPEEPLRLMSVHAHPDDESSKGAATLAKYAAEGVDVLVVTCTGGERGTVLNPALDRPEVRADLARIRREEMAAARDILGIRQQFLGFVDSGLPGDGEPLPYGCFATVPLEEATAALVALVRDFRPHVLLTYDETGGYPHPDHIRTHQVAVAAYREAGDETRFPEAGPAWQPLKLYYHGALSRAWFQALHDGMTARGIPSGMEEVLAEFGDEGADAAPEFTTRVPCAEHFPTRDRALLAHATQIDPNAGLMLHDRAVEREVWPTEDYHLADSRVPVSFPEDDLLAGIRPEPPKVLISGGGVAGSSVAYWLRQHGYAPTVVERASALRRGGQAVDFRGPALTVLERMGVLDQVRKRDTGMGDCTVVDAAGEPYAVIPAVGYAGELEVLIDELIEILHDRTAGTGVEYRFGDSITALVPDDDGVDVTFEHAPPERFDLVIGADGAHSAVRSLAFGPETDFAQYLGCYYAYWETDNHLGLDREGMATGDGRTAALSVFAVKDNQRTRVGLLFTSEDQLDVYRHDRQAQTAILKARSAHLGWQTPILLKQLDAAADLYFDAMTQIRMDTWSTGRIALVGDAAYCAAPTSGRGTSQALIGAHTLAAELAAAGGDHTVAFAAYEETMRPYVEHNQAIGVQGSQYVFAQPTQEMFDALADQAREPEADPGPQPLLRNC
ncbi:mycothiol conjugate amidase Mca [Streptomyces sp. NRRL S-337]|uniref:mycothiol conjugate amidase Mca n=1 Tax=Streptomyces sp. NRRL S-337 TaxID=1463900 RepID=UPI0007C4F749|nr:mycothiol conjugate amidase Mca [Streptomyces sp. NRRL S-337]